MSSELERRLREGRETLPEPDAQATERARGRALAAVRRRPPRARVATLIAVAFVTVLGVGMGLGSLIAPSSTAAPGPVGTGFLPGPGWTVLQTGEDATPERQALAVATNVPLHPEDAARGIRGSSGLPYSTLLELPKQGVVIVALFTRRESEPWNDEFYPERALPLRVQDAATSSFSYQLRPTRPLGQYELWATTGDHHVTLHFYFGTRHPSPQLIAAAQRQLDRLVVATRSAEATNARLSNPTVDSSASRLIDRTLSCAVFPQGGLQVIAVSARSGVRLYTDRSKWKYPAGADASDSAGGYVSVGAGNPVAGPEPGYPASPVRLGIRAGRTCAAAPRIPLSRASLPGGPASQLEDRYECFPGRRVLVRVRALFRSGASLRRKRYPSGEVFNVATGTVVEARVAVRSSVGKPLGYVEVFESGKARLFTAPECVPD